VAFNENEISDVVPSQKAEITIDAIEQQSNGTVLRVDTIGTLLSDVVVYYVYLSLDNPPEQLRPGMTVQVDILVKESKDILVIPNGAIKLYQGEKAVQMLDANTGEPFYQPISVGTVGDTQTEVVNGLTEGQEIILSEQSSVKSTSSTGFMRPPGN
jgi:macrolide-specific efflux system membrane fusion protein